MISCGGGVFETIELRAGRPFALTRHLARLRDGAARLGLRVPDDDATRSAIERVAAAWGDMPGRLRVTLTTDPDPLGPGEATLMVTAGPMRLLTEPTAVVVVPYLCNERGALAGVKSSAYSANVAASVHARRLGAGEALLTNTAGVLCEGAGSNVFVGLDGALVTPPLSSGCLAGVTRQLLLEALGRAGRPAIEADVPIERLSEVDEAFLVSTARHVQPVSRIDGRQLPGCPGPLTSDAAAVFHGSYDELSDP